MADQNCHISQFKVYQSKNKQLENEFSNYRLGKRVVLLLTKSYQKTNKFIYFDNYFTSICLLETLRIENTLACGTIRSSIKIFFKNLRDNKSLSKGDFDYSQSNTNIGYFKWKDNSVLNFATNFHDVENCSVKRTNKNRTKVDINCPVVGSRFTTTGQFISTYNLLITVI